MDVLGRRGTVVCSALVGCRPASVACIGRIGTLGRWCLHHRRAANERRYSTTSLLGTLTSAPGQACCVEAQHHSVQARLADRATAQNGIQPAGRWRLQWPHPPTQPPF